VHASTRFRVGAKIASATMLVVALGLLAACGGDGGGDEEANVTVDQQVGLEGDAILERQTKAENLIAGCMKAQGFEYTPVNAVEQRAELVGSRNLSEEEFNRQFGYGITTLFEKRLQQKANGPNQAYRNSLSESQRAIYDRALFGDDPTATFDVALDTGDFSRLGGCTKQAAEQVFGGAQLVETLTAKLDELDERILSDSRMTKAVDKWSECMSDKGYDVAAQDDVDVVLENKLEAIVGPVETVTAPAPGAQPTWDQEALKALQREEVEMVQADLECEEEHIAGVEEKVRAEYEREFREQNAGLLQQVPKP
jgi:hypothetical protein